MALIKCPECGKEISSFSEVCIGCGYPIKAMQNTEQNNSVEMTTCENKYGIENSALDALYEKSNANKIKMIKLLREDTNLDLYGAKTVVETYWQNHIENKAPVVSKQKTEIKPVETPVSNFNGIMKYTTQHGYQKVYCPRCGSSNCSHYQQEKFVQGKTKTRYTANLNPLKPFTLVNKKEKVVRKDQLVTEQKLLCNNCGHIFD